MAIIVERKVGHGESERGDIKFNTTRGASPGPTGPREGDLWYDKIRLRFVGRGISTIHRGFAGRYGPEFGAVSQKTISGGVAPVTSGWTGLVSESGTADDLDSLTLASDVGVGDLIVLTAITTHTITVTSGVGNIRLDGGTSKVLDTVNDALVLMVAPNGTDLIQIAFSNNPL